MLPGKKTLIDNYEVLATIGQGGFGKVKLARHLPTGTQVAVKVIAKNQQNPTRMKRLGREVQSLKALDHPNVVKLFEVIDTRHTLFLVMEYASRGDMHAYIRNHGRMTEDQARGMFRQLVSAVHYCHQKGIVHRDLKPENVLFDDDLNVKVTDFGLSNTFLGRKLASYCGTLYCAAPEILQHRKYDGPPVDVWSLGVALYIMLTGQVPFPGEDFATVRQQVLRGRHPEYPVYLSLNCLILLRRMMTLSPILRITLEEIMDDPWVGKGQEKLRPYREPPHDKRDPSVIEAMMQMGFERDKIQKSLRKMKYDHLMATYLILTSKKPKVEGHTVARGSILSFDPKSRRSFPSFEVQPEVSAPGVRRIRTEPVLPTWFRRAAEPKEKQESGLKTKEPASPPPRPESRPATHRPTPRRGPRALPATPGTSKGRGTPGRAKCPGGGQCGTGDSLDAGQPDGTTPASPSGPSQGRRGAAGRFLSFIRHLCSCLPSKKKRGRHNRVKPL